MDLSESFAPNSEQLTYAEIGERIVTVTVEKVTPRSDKPKDPAIHFVEFPGKPLLPGVNVGTVLRRAWGTNGGEWVGRRMKLYGDPDVYFGKEKTGGVRVSHVSDITGPVSVRRRGKGAHGSITVEPLVESRADLLRAEWKTADPERRKAIEAEVAQLAAAETAGGAE